VIYHAVNTRLRRQKACTAAGSVRGEKTAQIAHLIGGKGVAECQHSSEEAKSEARDLRASLIAAAETSKKRQHTDDSHNTNNSNKRPRVEKKLKTYTGVNMPFSQSESQAIKAQALRAIISTNSSFGLFENPEMQTLFKMIRTTSVEILPSRKVASGRLLNDAAVIVEGKINKVMHQQELGLRYVSKEQQFGSHFSNTVLMDGSLSQRTALTRSVLMWTSRHMY
jgi:hypothetical protein